jgi:hypothetical protein
VQRDVSLFLDESGGFGRSPRSPRHIVAAGLSTTDPFHIRRLVRKANRKFGPRERRLGELKFRTASQGLRMRMIQGIADSDVTIAYAASCTNDRRGTPISGQELLITSLFEDVVGALARESSVRRTSIVVDRRRVRDNVRCDFDRRLKDAAMRCHPGLFPPVVTVTHLDSQTSEGLQAADFVAGAMFQHLERGDSRYLRILAPRVTFSRLV